MATEHRSPETELRDQFKSLLISLKAGFFVLSLGISYLNIRLALAIHWFQQLFTDMLGGKPLPAATEFVLNFRFVLQVTSIILPVLAIVALFWRSTRSVAVISGVVCFALVQWVLTSQALMAPVTSIISGMQGNASP